MKRQLGVAPSPAGLCRPRRAGHHYSAGGRGVGHSSLLSLLRPQGLEASPSRPGGGLLGTAANFNFLRLVRSSQFNGGLAGQVRRSEPRSRRCAYHQPHHVPNQVGCAPWLPCTHERVRLHVGNAPPRVCPIRPPPFHAWRTVTRAHASCHARIHPCGRVRIPTACTGISLIPRLQDRNGPDAPHA